MYNVLQCCHLAVLRQYLVPTSLLQPAKHGMLYILQSDSPPFSWAYFDCILQGKLHNYHETTSKFCLFFVGELLQPQADRRTPHTPATHFTMQLSEVTDRALFVHENVMLRLAACAQYLA